MSLIFLYCPYTGPNDDNKYCRNVDTNNLKFVLYLLTDPHIPSLKFIDQRSLVNYGLMINKVNNKVLLLQLAYSTMLLQKI